MDSDAFRADTVRPEFEDRLVRADGGYSVIPLSRRENWLPTPKHVGVSVLGALRTLACAQKSMGPKCASNCPVTSRNSRCS
jgi:hypothetical protein